MRHAGFTLWELVCTVAIAAVVLTIGGPSLHRFVLDGRRTADINGFVLAVQLARSEAAKRGRDVIVCPTTDRLLCTDFERGTSHGWMVFINGDDTHPPHRSNEEELVYYHALEMVGAVVANRPYFEFRPRLRRSVNGTVTFCDERGTPAARAVVVSYSGRPRVDDRSADGKPLRCAILS